MLCCDNITWWRNTSWWTKTLTQHDQMINFPFIKLQQSMMPNTNYCYIAHPTCLKIWSRLMIGGLLERLVIYTQSPLNLNCKLAMTPIGFIVSWSLYHNMKVFLNVCFKCLMYRYISCDPMNHGTDIKKTYQNWCELPSEHTRYENIRGRRPFTACPTSTCCMSLPREITVTSLRKGLEIYKRIYVDGETGWAGNMICTWSSHRNGKRWGLSTISQ